ncbi:NepR family anti-sigma factor [Brevundimonas diminuta]|uniref:anti-sigma T factor NepR n=1 Tax=Brevundimonas diminuta TaxID=293 RepID=UPI003D03CD02
MINTKDTPVHPDGSPSRDAGLDEVQLRQQAIGVKLRHMFDEVVNEPVPDEFLDILRRADAASSTREGQ